VLPLDVSHSLGTLDMKPLRRIRQDESGVASTVGTIMALLVFLTFIRTTRGRPKLSRAAPPLAVLKRGKAARYPPRNGTRSVEPRSNPMQVRPVWVTVEPLS